MRIAKRHNISGEVFLSILKEIQKENPNIIIESNLRKELKASLDSIKTWYNSEKLNVFNNDGNEILSCVCLLKDLVDFSETVIREKKVIDPEIVIGADSGQNKMIVTLSIFDRSDTWSSCVPSAREFDVVGAAALVVLPQYLALNTLS